MKIYLLAISIFICLSQATLGRDDIHNVQPFNQLIGNRSPQDTFRTEVLENKKPVIVKFYLEDCPPCMRTKPILEKLARTYKNITFIEIDSNAYNAIAEKYSILSVPTFIYFLNGQEQGRLIGGKTETEFKSKIKEYFKA